MSQSNQQTWAILAAYGCKQGNGSTQGWTTSMARLKPFLKGNGFFFNPETGCQQNIRAQILHVASTLA
jgi:hypothetical protein